jgi:hypothetical protein
MSLFVIQEPQPGAINLDLSDDDTYDQSSIAGRIDALDYVSIDHPLLPPLRARSANSVMAITNRVRHHPEFWWDVVLAMQERIYQDKNSNHYQGLRAELIKLRGENERLKRETSKLRQQMAKDKTIITHLRKVTPSTRGIQTGRATRLETPLPETPDDIKKNNMESLSERKRKRTTTFSGNSNPSDDSETDASLNEEIARARRGNESKDTRLKRLEATVEKLMQRSGQVV